MGIAIEESLLQIKLPQLHHKKSWMVAGVVNKASMEDCNLGNYCFDNIDCCHGILFALWAVGYHAMTLSA